MATNKRAIVQRMEVTSKYNNAHKYAWAQTIAVLILISCVVAFVLTLNAILPRGW